MSQISSILTPSDPVSIVYFCIVTKSMQSNAYIYENYPSLHLACRADWHFHTVPEHLLRFSCQVIFFSSYPHCISILPWAEGILAHCTKHKNCTPWHLLFFVSLTGTHCILSWCAGIEIVVGIHLGHTPVPNTFFWGNKVYFVVTGKPATAKPLLFFYLIYDE